jgi:hypothetical protein
MPSCLRTLPMAFAAVVLGHGAAGADVRGAIRVGVATLELTPRAGTPVMGEPIDDAVAAYNAAAAAYDELHRTPTATAPIDRGDLALHGTLVTVAPALEAGGDHYFVRLEASLGVGADLRSYGVGLYPVNLAVPLRGGAMIPYVAIGGTVSWLDRPGADGEIGGLVVARAAVGARLVRRIAVEVGYGAFVLGGVVDHGRLDQAMAYDPRGAAPPPRPDEAVSGGEQRGLVDVSVGVTW